jgi:hypothetical protein
VPIEGTSLPAIFSIRYKNEANKVPNELSPYCKYRIGNSNDHDLKSQFHQITHFSSSQCEVDVVVDSSRNDRISMMLVGLTSVVANIAVSYR